MHMSVRLKVPLFPLVENRDTFFTRVHGFILPYHDDGIRIAKTYGDVKKAFDGKKRARGERYFEHCRAVALILIDYADCRDPDMIIGALAHDLIEDIPGWSRRRVARLFGKVPAGFVAALTIPEGDFPTREAKLEAYHKQLFAAAKKDPRVILIKLADRLHNLSTCESLARENQIRMVEETERIYIPAAKERGVLHDELVTLCSLVRRRLGRRPNAQRSL